MSTQEILRQESETLPETLLQEVLDFTRFLKATRLPALKLETDDDKLPPIDWGKTGWAANWDGAEEDEAWKDL